MTAAALSPAEIREAVMSILTAMGPTSAEDMADVLEAPLACLQAEVEALIAQGKVEEFAGALRWRRAG